MMREDVIGLSHLGLCSLATSGQDVIVQALASTEIWEKSRDGPHPLWKAVASVRAIWSGASPRPARATRSCELAI